MIFCFFFRIVLLFSMICLPFLLDKKRRFYDQRLNQAAEAKNRSTTSGSRFPRTFSFNGFSDAFRKTFGSLLFICAWSLVHVHSKPMHVNLWFTQVRFFFRAKRLTNDGCIRTNQIESVPGIR